MHPLRKIVRCYSLKNVATAGRRSFLITDLKTSLLALQVAQLMMSNLGKYLDIPALMPKGRWWRSRWGLGLATGRSPVRVPARPSATEVSLSKAPFPTLLPGRRTRQHTAPNTRMGQMQRNNFVT